MGNAIIKGYNEHRKMITQIECEYEKRYEKMNDVFAVDGVVSVYITTKEREERMKEIKALIKK